MFKRLPPLATLDNLITNAMSFGFVFITLGVIAGSTWAFIDAGTAWISDPRIALAFITWGFYLTMVFLRQTAGWRGRKAACMAVAVLCCSGLTWAAHVGLAEPDRQMKFSITGVNHKSAPVEVRERLAFDESALSQALVALKGRPGFCEGMILSTCNRVEVALTCEDNSRTARLAVDEFLADTRQVRREWVTPYLYRFEDSDAIRHLFRVAASLDSMVIGEPQILGQLKSAYSLAKEHGAVSGFMDALLTRAFNVAKRVTVRDRHRRERGVHQLCGGGAGARDFRLAEGKKVMIVGAGKMSRTGGAAPAAQRRGTNPGHQSHARARARNGGAVRRQAGGLHALPLGSA